MREVMTPRRSSLIALAVPAALLGAALFAGGAQALTLQSQTYQLSGADTKQRLTVRCPGKRSLPYSGGMVTDPLGSDGEGVYPHSYERLGVQRGWHVAALLYDPDHRSTQPRNVTLQVTCGPRLGHVTPPHKTKYVKPGQTKTVVATCPGRRHLF